MNAISHATLYGYTADDAMTDYRKLVGNTDGAGDKSLIGNIAIDYHFMDARLKTRTPQGQTAVEWIVLNKDKPYVKRLIEYNMAKGFSLERASYKAFQLYSRAGCMNAFRPLLAKRLYQRYKPKVVLDPCAGWGGRCLAAMALDIDYIGYDTDRELAPLYEQLRIYPTKSIVQFHNTDCLSMDVSGYDMVFTSPPYCKNGKLVELYPDMPTYTNQWEFNIKFLFPMIHKAWAGLAMGGTFALNIPSYMYDDVVPLLGAANESILLQSKNTRNAYKEYIYVWSKTDRMLPAVAWPLAEVRSSAVHGLGAFATTAIPAQTRIAHYVGQRFSIADFTRKYGKNIQHCYSLGRANAVLCGKDEPYYSTNLSHFMNESLEPNVVLRNCGAYAARDIAPGEELFLRYPKSYPRNYELKSV